MIFYDINYDFVNEFINNDCSHILMMLFVILIMILFSLLSGNIKTLGFLKLYSMFQVICKIRSAFINLGHFKTLPSIFNSIHVYSILGLDIG